MLVMFSNTALLILNFNKLYASSVSALFDVDDNNSGVCVAVDKFIYLNTIQRVRVREYMNI